MCGIAGVYWLDQPPGKAIVEAMCERIRHRGPDEDGFHVDGQCAIGMRRLSIIDLSSGRQPIANEDRTVWVVFNGEIYNYQPLREDLLRRGHRFSTNSDTETLVHLYEEWGEEGLSKLRGMFAYAIWDARRRRILLARDRFGKKPLYYAIRNRRLYFGSELKCLRAARLELEVDREALRWYFQFSYIPDPHTCFRDVHKVPAASWLSFDAEARVEQGTYWRLPEPAEEPEPGWSAARSRERLRELFDESVRLRLMSDVPLGAFLSGGIDSSLVVASMARQMPEPVKTFSIGFEDAEFNETGYARMVA